MNRTANVFSASLAMEGSTYQNWVCKINPPGDSKEQVSAMAVVFWHEQGSPAGQLKASPPVGIAALVNEVVLDEVITTGELVMVGMALEVVGTSGVLDEVLVGTTLLEVDELVVVVIGTALEELEVVVVGTALDELGVVVVGTALVELIVLELPGVALVVNVVEERVEVLVVRTVLEVDEVVVGTLEVLDEVVVGALEVVDGAVKVELFSRTMLVDVPTEFVVGAVEETPIDEPFKVEVLNVELLVVLKDVLQELLLEVLVEVTVIVVLVLHSFVSGLLMSETSKIPEMTQVTSLAMTPTAGMVP
ncbi:hypothetical protein B0A48_09010 [Cryoendolithus antarcticus]|uniref:Uncharacterized protein n=1 Tax=Cryoendolithus antarcticus TaxID=1507870 RepID=A0A1V8T1E4_9PEZI|nr:hypothetical protein B0A48_09010 [Cryoendolithus antarcticus]